MWALTWARLGDIIKGIERKSEGGGRAQRSGGGEMEERRDRRFKEPGMPRQWETKQLWDHHKEILRRLAMGQRSESIAADLGITTQTVSNTRNSALGRAKVTELQSARDAEATEIAKRIEEFAPVCLDLLEDVIQGRAMRTGRGEPIDMPMSSRVRVAERHLSRAGHGEIKRRFSVTKRLTDEEIEGIKSRSVAAMKEAGVINAQFERIEE
jgi:hypothetical protein